MKKKSLQPSAIPPHEPRLTRLEAKHEATATAARGIVDRHASRQNAKTEKQRAARLARDAAVPASELLIPKYAGFNWPTRPERVSV